MEPLDFRFNLYPLSDLAHDDRGRNVCATFWILPDDSMEAQDSPLQALKKSLKLFATLDMLMLCVYFYYTGMLLSFWSVVYGTSLSRTQGPFQNEKKFGLINKFA